MPEASIANDVSGTYSARILPLKAARVSAGSATELSCILPGILVMYRVLRTMTLGVGRLSEAERRNRGRDGLNWAFEHLVNIRITETPELRAARIGTLTDTWLLQIMSILWGQVVGWFTLVITAQPWALGWIIVDAMLQVRRARLKVRCGQAMVAGVRPPYRPMVLTNIAWFAVMAIGDFGSLHTGDVRLLVLAGFLPIGFMGYIASRYAALPRTAACLLYMLGAAQVAGFLGTPTLLYVALLSPAAPFAFHMLMLQSHTILMDALVAKETHFRMSMHDPLTGLPNRLLLRERMSALLDEMAVSRQTSGFAVLCLDLDGFKPVNDRYGHAGGDWLLKSVAERMRMAVRAQDLVCRVGGDEFVVLLPGANHGTAVIVAERLIESCSEPHDLDGVALARIGLSVGIALAPIHGRHTDELLAHADAALYTSKRRAKGTWTFHPVPG
ncbi:MAG TPA: GGDEF domain-containing protein [Rugosimonospora sp.]|nr:GGDEF domain-containing protein [Rugosimonospora sp.]